MSAIEIVSVLKKDKVIMHCYYLTQYSKEASLLLSKNHVK